MHKRLAHGDHERASAATSAGGKREMPGGVTPDHLRQRAQFIAKDFKEFIRISGMTHVIASPYYPQLNGKIERWHKSLKGECIRPGTPLSLEDARRLVEGYVEHYNNVRFEQRHRLHHAERHARRASAGNSGPSGIESWRRRGHSVRSTGRTPIEEEPRSKVADETHHFRLADDPCASTVFAIDLCPQPRSAERRYTSSLWSGIGNDLAGDGVSVYLPGGTTVLPVSYQEASDHISRRSFAGRAVTPGDLSACILTR